MIVERSAAGAVGVEAKGERDGDGSEQAINESEQNNDASAARRRGVFDEDWGRMWGRGMG